MTRRRASMNPRIWTGERDVVMWRALEHGGEMKSAEIQSWPNRSKR
jgi:hypothetical protein